MSVIWKAIKHGHGIAQRLVDDRQYDNCSIQKRASTPFQSISDLLSQPTLVVAAHPDDEVTGAGILLSRNPKAGVLTITDGAPQDGRQARDAGFATARDYGRARRREAAAALSLLDRPIAVSMNFAIPDQRVVFKAESITRRLLRIFQTHSFRYVVTHPYEGGHPDHDATALAVHAACLLLEKDGLDAPTQVEMTSYHAADEQMVYDAFLQHDAAGPVEIFPLDAAERALKQSMFDCHKTQRGVLLKFPLDAERFRLAPAYNFLDLPPTRQIAYERYDWDINAKMWCSAAARALYRLKLLDPA